MKKNQKRVFLDGKKVGGKLAPSVKGDIGRLEKYLASSCSFKVHPKLSAYFGYCLHKSAMKLRAETNSALEEFGLISPQLGILFLLEADGSKSQVDLGSCLAIDKATMVKLVDGLEERGWIKREGHKEDRRIKTISLTAQGENNFQTFRKLREGVEKRFLSVLSNQEEKELRRLIPKLLGQ